MSDNRFWGTVQTALDERNFATARELLEERLRRDPRESHTLTLAAQAARRDGDLGRFDTLIDRAESAAAVAEVVALERALARVQTGRTADIGHYLEVAQSHPLDPASKLLLEAIVEGAIVRLDLPAAQRAVALWDSAAKTAEQRAASDSWKGEIAVRRGDIAAAADCYRKAVAATPASVNRRRRLADLLARYSPTEALEHLDLAESQGSAPTPSTLLTRARCQRALSDFEAAEQSLRKL
ncbi:MAG: tetratricopeptide repeat protein, partial [Planctomycetota bacterium]